MSQNRTESHWRDWVAGGMLALGSLPFGHHRPARGEDTPLPRTAAVASENTTVAPQGTVMIVGGGIPNWSNADLVTGAFNESPDGIDPDGLYDKFLSLSPKARKEMVVTCITSSGENEAHKAAESHRIIFEHLGVKKVNVITAQTRAEIENNPEILRMIEESDAFWFSGGNQNVPAVALGGTAAHDLLLECYRNKPTIFGGSSAGMAVQALVMTAGDGEAPGGMPKVAKGLGTLPKLVLEQHLNRKGRPSRFLNLLLGNVDNNGIGLGLHVNTAAIFHPHGKVEIFGKNEAVLAFRKDHADHVIPECQGAVCISRDAPEEFAHFRDFADRLGMYTYRHGMSFTLKPQMMQHVVSVPSQTASRTLAP